jgi:hypothetical protein
LRKLGFTTVSCARRREVGVGCKPTYATRAVDKARIYIYIKVMVLAP